MDQHIIVLKYPNNVPTLCKDISTDTIYHILEFDWDGALEIEKTNISINNLTDQEKEDMVIIQFL
jgi:hypothetical protein